MEGLKAIGFKGYRSIGEKPVLLYPLKKVNFFVGPNNCGKSNILRYISTRNTYPDPMTDLDYPNYNKTIKKKKYVSLSFNEVYEFCNKFSIKSLASTIKNSDLFYPDEKYQIVWKSELTKDEMKEISEKEIESNWRFHDDIMNKYYSRNFLDNMMQALSDFCRFCEGQEHNLETLYIKADRDLYDNNKNSFLNDSKIIDKLNEIVNNNPGELDNIEKAQSINSFVSSLIGEEIKLKIPSERNTISITYEDDFRGERERNIEQLGSGIHEVIYFAIVATINKSCLICIDEPEIHMHPRLQRKFLDYLIENTDNQYFIATHSSAFLNTSSKDVSVFRTWMNEDRFTECEYCFSPNDVSTTLDELGCRASDLLQTNCVIWVEGPSDRIYLNYWLSGHNFVEGVDYSIMFYGGRLLFHLSGDGDSQRLINLFKINRNSFILIDSDKNSEDDSINDTKERIKTVFSVNCWITDGREIENYLPLEQFKDVFKSCFNADYAIPEEDQFVNRLKKRDGTSYDKVKFAMKFVEKYGTQEQIILSSSLKKKIDTLVDFIKKANK